MTEKKEQGKFFYGWVVAVVCGLLYMLSSGSILSAAQLVNPGMMAATGMAPTMMGLGFTVFVLFQSFGAPFTGFLVSKIGAKLTMVIGGVIVVVCSLIMALVDVGVVGYLIFFGVLLSVSTLMVGQIATQSTVGLWFTRYRGRAMTITMVIGRIGAFITPLIIGALMAAGGWAFGYFAMAAYGAIAIVLALVFIKNKPEDIGQLPDGGVAEEGNASAASTPEKPSRVYKNADSVTLKQALKRPAFYLIVLALCAGFYAFSNNAGNAVAHFTASGFDPAMIAVGVSVLGICMMIGVFLAGIISDFVEPIRLMGFLGIFTAVGVFVAAFVTESWAIFVYYILVGLTFGGISNLVPTAVANYWGRDHFPKILGTTMMLGGFITSWAGTIGGAIFESTGAYTMAFIIAGVVIVICALCGIFMRIPKANKTK